ncbi:MAG: hypothetical protein K0S55_82 [Clostridia bacterium]|nr:hypothetical protein [Clostridia bacterium]
MKKEAAKNKKSNKITVISVIVIIILLLTAAVAFAIPKDNTWFSFEVFSTSLKVNSFLNAIIKEDYEGAFNNLYYYDKATDIPPEISEAEAKQIWVERMEKLKVKGVFLESFNNLKLHTDDSYMQGTVVITISENGAPRSYETTLFLAKSSNSWKIGGISTEELLTEFENAVSGYIAK